MRVKTTLGAVVLALMLPLTASATPYYGTFTDGMVYDLWTFTIGAGGANFSANTIGSPNTASGYELDTQLWIFDSNWVGVVGNDNMSPDPSHLYAQVNPLFLTGGTYYLGITLYNDDPVSLSGPMFPGDEMGQLWPLNSDPLLGWVPGVGQGYPYNGPYVLNLEGVESAAPVPEPASMTLFGTGLAVLYRTYRKRQRS